MTAGACHPDLRRVAEAAEVRSPTRFAVCGELCDLAGLRIPDPPGGAAETAGEVPAGGSDPAAEVLLRALEGEIYHRLYSRSPGPTPPSEPDAAEALAWVSALSQANSGTGTYEPDWLVASVDPDGRIAVRKDAVVFWAAPDEVRADGGRVAPGQACRVRVGKELRRLLPGFYAALGDAPEPAGPPAEGLRLRLYWHLTRASAVAYIRTATAALNAARVPFRTKVLADPRQYVRADSGVLYLRRADLDRARGAVRTIHGALQADLRPDVPLFTRRLAPGLGLAEDPGDAMSFGQSRCRLAARALWTAYTRGHASADERLADLIETFRASGCDPEHPHLQPGSRDSYRFDL